MRELALCAGVGGGLLGSAVLAWLPVCAVEIDEYRRRVLLARQRDGCLPSFPIWDDLRTFDGLAWRGRVDVISAGFPCQPFSIAGQRRGAFDTRNLWPEVARVVGEVGPEYIFLENSPRLADSGYLGEVLGSLAALGYNAAWGVFGGRHVGAPIRRDRLWIVACSNRVRCVPGPPFLDRSVGRSGWEEEGHVVRVAAPRGGVGTVARLMPSARLRGMAARSAHGLDRLAAVGDGQIPAVAAFAWRTLLSYLVRPRA